MNKNKMRFSANSVYMTSIFLISLLFANATNAQNETEEDETTKNTSESDRIPLSERLFYGGNFQLNFGQVTIIDISPNVGLQLTENMQVGVGLTYQYYRRRAGTYSTGSYTYNADAYQTSIYGGRIFGRYFPVPTMFVHAEAEALSYTYEDVTDFGYKRRRAWVPGVFVGGGYNQPLGRSAAASLTILYNLTYNKIRSPYNSPWVIRMGFTL